MMTMMMIWQVVAAKCRESQEHRVRASVLRGIRLKLTEDGKDWTISQMIKPFYPCLTFITDHLAKAGRSFIRQSCVEDPGDEWLVLNPDLA